MAAAAIVLTGPATSQAVTSAEVTSAATPTAAVSGAAVTGAAAANPCVTHGISLRQGSFDYIECHYAWGVRVAGRLHNGDGGGGCIKVEVNFDNGGYRYKTRCSGGSVDLNWSEGGVRDAYAYLSWDPI